MANRIPPAVLRRIQACLRLAQSANPNEAAVALRRAQALAEEHDVTISELPPDDIAEVRQRRRESVPKPHHVALVNTVRLAFGIEVVLDGDAWVWIGPAHRVAVADYAWHVLDRALKTARRRFLGTLRKGVRRATKIRRADAFCYGWVSGVFDQVREFGMSEEDRRAIDKALRLNYPKSTKRSVPYHVAGRRLMDAFARGEENGKTVRLYHGVDAARAPRRIEE